MKKPDEIALPEDFPGLHSLHPMELQLGVAENEKVMQDVNQRRIQVPPCIIDGKEVEIFSFTPNEGDLHFDAPRIAETIVALITQGKKAFSMDVPGITARVIGNILNPGRMYFVEQEWQQLLEQLLPQYIKERTGTSVACTVTVLDTQPLPTIHGEFTVRSGEIQ